MWKGAALGNGGRWGLAWLCLLASLVFLGRATAPATFQLAPVALAPVTQVQAAAGRAGHYDGLTPPRSSTSGPVRSSHHPAPGTAPDEPLDRRHGHAAHCLFCLTSAFALEAEGGFVVPPSLQRSERAAPAHVRLHLARLRHADARAPPVQRG